MFKKHSILYIDDTSMRITAFFFKMDIRYQISEYTCNVIRLDYFRQLIKLNIEIMKSLIHQFIVSA